MNRTGFSQRLELRQAQTLVMTPQLQQAIKMLQLSNLELVDYIDAELQQNPLLERHERSVSAGEEAAAPAEEPGTATLTTQSTTDFAPEATENWHAAAGEDGDGSLDRGGEVHSWSAQSAAPRPGQRLGIEHTATRPRTLREHVLEQIGTDLGDQGDRIVALHLLDQLDEAGYLIGHLDNVALTLGCAPAQVEAVLARLQQFDPAGIFARDLPECLALQLRERNRMDPAMQSLLENLPLLAARNIAALVKACGVDAADVADMVAEIKSLDPRPGLAFDPPLAQPVVPDILLRAQSEGGWIVELNTETLPRVLVNNRYLQEVSRAVRNKLERDYLTERLQAANWLVKSLHQRATTILKVAAEIVRQQDAFFRRGVQSLRPLILRDIAEAIGMHESTVSRVTSNKYMATPRGLYELKYFFTTSIAGASGGEPHSAEAVRHRIRDLIGAEPAGNTLSDERIVELLMGEGVEIARRTVAKYRDAMRIRSSAQRRREKLLQL
ncbi:MAG: RNA polymerase factor sigma-54 [Stellaceae bacterium]